jgi:hypothetical protein
MSESLLRAAALLVLILGGGAASAQSAPQTVTVPLSRPGEPMALHIEMLSARIEVIGEDRKDAEFTLKMVGGERSIVMPSGTKKLPGGTFELSVDEDDNTISVETDGHHTSKMEVVARIPRRANLHLSTVMHGEIIVRDIAGNLELENVNGPITATNINGSLIAESVNDVITVGLTGIDDSAATSLSSLNGDILLSLPANAGFELRMDNQRGEIQSDFELDVKPSKTVVDRKEGRDGVSVRLESIIVATVNGGGPVIRMKTLNGDIKITRAGARK